MWLFLLAFVFRDPLIFGGFLILVKSSRSSPGGTEIIGLWSFGSEIKIAGDFLFDLEVLLIIANLPQFRL